MKAAILLIGFCFLLSQQLYSQTKPKEYRFDDVMQIAARLFFPSLDDDNDMRIKTTICDNGQCFVDSEKNIDSELKNFCFSTVENDLLKNRNNEEVKQVFQTYSNLCKEIAQMNWSSNKKTRLQRIQGAIWYAWANNKQFQAIIWKSYIREQATLPFVIKKSDE